VANGNIDITILDQRLKSQIEAYEQFATTYHNILDSVNSNTQKLSELKNYLGDNNFLKDLLLSIQKLIDDLDQHHDNTKEFIREVKDKMAVNVKTYEIISDKIEYQGQKVEELNSLLKRLVSTLDTHNKDHEDFYREVKNKILQTEESFQKFKQEFDAFKKDSEMYYATFPVNQISELYDNSKKYKQWFFKAGVFFMVLCTIIGIVATMVQLNIIDLTFFPKAPPSSHSITNNTNVLK
jgi:DNA repair exonuclease SbcCD ATPase subunit